jgi:hypothetical protein
MRGADYDQAVEAARPASERHLLEWSSTEMLEALLASPAGGWLLAQLMRRRVLPAEGAPTSRPRCRCHHVPQPH